MQWRRRIELVFREPFHTIWQRDKMLCECCTVAVRRIISIIILFSVALFIVRVYFIIMRKRMYDWHPWSHKCFHSQRVRMCASQKWEHARTRTIAAGGRIESAGEHCILVAAEYCSAISKSARG